jgi:hypothetical protein
LNHLTFFQIILMKVIKIKPRLVDHSLFRTPTSKPSFKPLKPKPQLQLPSEPIRLSFWFNLIGFLILCMGGLIIYNRYANKDKIREDKTHSIIGFTQYVNDVKNTINQDTENVGKSEPEINNL